MRYHGPDCAEVVRDRDGVKHVRFSFMEEKRWVLDVMYGSGARRTVDLMDGNGIDLDALTRLLVPPPSAQTHPSHAHAATVAELVVMWFGSPASFGRSGIVPSRGIVFQDAGADWDRAALTACVRRHASCGFEALSDALRQHYGLPLEP